MLVGDGGGEGEAEIVSCLLQLIKFVSNVLRRFLCLDLMSYYTSKHDVKQCAICCSTRLIIVD